MIQIHSRTAKWLLALICACLAALAVGYEGTTYTINGEQSVDALHFAQLRQNSTGEVNNVGSTIYTNKSVYQAWDQVIIDARAQNLESYSSFAGGQGELIVTDQAGDVIHRATIPINGLAPFAIATRQVHLALVDSTPGTYEVTWTVSAEGQSLVASQAKFEVVSGPEYDRAHNIPGSLAPWVHPKTSASRVIAKQSASR